MVSIEEKFLDDEIDAGTFHSMKQRTQVKIEELKADLKNLQTSKKELEEYLQLGISLFRGIDSFYTNAESIDELASIIHSKHKGFKRLKIKKPTQIEWV